MGISGKLCVSPAYQVVEEGVCRLGRQHGDMLCVW